MPHPGVQGGFSDASPSGGGGYDATPSGGGGFDDTWDAYDLAGALADAIEAGQTNGGTAGTAAVQDVFSEEEDLKELMRRWSQLPVANPEVGLGETGPEFSDAKTDAQVRAEVDDWVGKYQATTNQDKLGLISQGSGRIDQEGMGYYDNLVGSARPSGRTDKEGQRPFGPGYKVATSVFDDPYDDFGAIGTQEDITGKATQVAEETKNPEYHTQAYAALAQERMEVLDALRANPHGKTHGINNSKLANAYARLDPTMKAYAVVNGPAKLGNFVGFLANAVAPLGFNLGAKGLKTIEDSLIAKGISDKTSGKDILEQVAAAIAVGDPVTSQFAVDSSLSEGVTDFVTEDYTGLPGLISKASTTQDNEQSAGRVAAMEDLSGAIPDRHGKYVGAFAGAGEWKPPEKLYEYDSCFIEGVQVELADGIEKDVAEISIGDVVKTKDGEGAVVKVFHSKAGKQRLYGFNEKEPFVTEAHPFMTQDGWKKISEVKVGDTLYRNGLGLDTVRSIESKDVPEDTPVFNFHVDTHENYYAAGYLVHNKTMPVPEEEPTWDEAIDTSQLEQPLLEEIVVLGPKSEVLEERLKNLINTNSPLFKAATTKALQSMNSAGLTNSSIAQEAVMAAILGVAIPIAQQDAQTFLIQRMANQTASNTFKAAQNAAYYEAFQTKLTGQINQTLRQLADRSANWRAILAERGAIARTAGMSKEAAENALKTVTPTWFSGISSQEGALVVDN